MPSPLPSSVVLLVVAPWSGTRNVASLPPIRESNKACACMCIYIYVYKYSMCIVYLSVCLSVCLYVCMYVCMYIYSHIHAYDI